MARMRKLWERWKVISNKILDKEATIILTILYIILVYPIALIYKLFADSLNLKTKKKSFWFEKETENVSSLESFKKQY